MAFVFDYTAPFLTVFEDAYARVTKVDINVPEQRASIEVWVYPDQATRATDQDATVQRLMLPVYETPEAPHFSTYFSAVALSVEGMNPIKAAYAYLKTLGQFAGAVDVL